MKVLKRILGFFFVNFIAYSVLADTVVNPIPAQEPSPALPSPNIFSELNWFDWPARISAWGLGGDRAIGIGDSMLPLVGNEAMMFYADAQGKYASDQNWFGGIALGFREIFNNERILGAYLFADRNAFDTGSSLPNSTFYFVNPGLESMGNIWDFRVNGYIPVNNQRDHIGTTFADNVGDFNFVMFRGHQQFNRLFDIINVTGPGVDAEIGRVIPGLPNTRVYLGGYYFGPKNTSSIEGIEGRVNYPINHYLALTVADTYDNTFKNSFQAGIKVTLGGIPSDVDKDNQDIERRMLDPIARNLATLSHGTAEPVVRTTKDEGKILLERDNIYFFTTIDGTTFNPALGTQNCTFEHPCSGISFTQSTVNSIGGFAPGANFYFDPGVYTLGLADSISDQVLAGQLSLVNGQSMFGRIRGYTQPASGNQRPIFVGSLALPGNDVLDSFQLLNDGTQTTAITASNTGNILINNLQIGSLDPGTSYPTAINLTNVLLFTANNSTIDAFNTGTGDVLAEAVNATGSVLFFNGDTINAQTSVTDPATTTATANGITINNSIIAVNNSTVNANTLVNTNPNSGSATAINAGSNNLIAINSSHLNAIETFNTLNGSQSFATDISLQTNNNLTVNNSTLTALNNTTSGAPVITFAFGINGVSGNAVSVNQSNFIVNNSTVSVDATFPTAEGIAFSGSGNALAVNGSSLNVSAFGSSPPGIETDVKAVGIELGSGNSAIVTGDSFTVTSNAIGNTGSSTAFGIDNSGGGNALFVSGDTFHVTAIGTPGIVVTQADINP